MQEFKNLLLNYPTMLENDQQIAIKVVMKEDEAGYKNIDTIVEDKLQIHLRNLIHLEEEIFQGEENTALREGRKIIESAVITPPPLIHPEALTSLSGLNASILTTMKRHLKGKNLTRLINLKKTTWK